MIDSTNPLGPEEENKQFKSQIEMGVLVPLKDDPKISKNSKLGLMRKFLQEGKTIEEAAKLSGYVTSKRAQNALASHARHQEMRKILLRFELGDTRVAKELAWGIDNSKGCDQVRPNFTAHARYIELLMNLHRVAYPDKVIGESEEADVEQLTKYIKANLSEGDARKLTDGLKQFARNRKSSI